MLLTLVLAVVSATPAASLPLRPLDTPLAAKDECGNARTYQAEDGQSRLRLRRLDELPPGRLELTVLRQFDRCPIPAVLRDNIGGRALPEGGPASRR